jgi:hypothetical protein
MLAVSSLPAESFLFFFSFLCTNVWMSTGATHLWLAPTLLLLLELGTMTQTDLSASLWLHINMTQRTNRIGDLTRYRVSWGSPL